MINIAIVEDEAMYAKQLQEFLQQYQKENGEVFNITVYSDGDQIVHKYKSQFDIILMDVEMKFMDGMSAAEEIRKADTEVVIIFITNMAQYAIRGYAVDALDYVLGLILPIFIILKVRGIIWFYTRSWGIMNRRER